ncbi:uncharacterized protein BDW43DRAFT_298516 [Aspergillus alliaceus]|uniref:uncharacterized protein n=1 Tax=Petromyces alliaceus TaxID=209559 RepID=UPI0012A49870|nr:uncharacterized protein BDW43DRAFT_298516 [Aspergillus alliaceus]KAB8235922.1 hypothetical protein BDW43DRAFT_298516 [Aspergillus alliaceus]
MTTLSILAVAPLSAGAFASPVPTQVPAKPAGCPVIVGQKGYMSDPYHGPHTGTPTTTGAVNAPATLAAAIEPKPPNSTATYYNSQGVPLHPMTAPYTPAGGLGTNGTLPHYMVESDFDFKSIALGVYQEYIELDLLLDGFAPFTDEEFLEAGWRPAWSRGTIADRVHGGPGDRTRDIAGQHAGRSRAKDVRIRLSVLKRSHVGRFHTAYNSVRRIESNSHLDSREVPNLLSLSITTEARQQMIFRQMSGPNPTDVLGTTRLAWQNFPTLRILNNPNINPVSPDKTPKDGSETVGKRITDPSVSDISRDENCLYQHAPLSYAGKQVLFEWEAPSKSVRPNSSYITTTTAGEPKFVPEGSVYDSDGIINGTMAVALTDLDLFVTPFNQTMLNPHIVALGLSMAG